MPFLASIFLLFIGIFLVVFWYTQFTDLMSRKDGEFPGKYDKPIWAALMICTFLLGAIVWGIYKEQLEQENCKTEKPIDPSDTSTRKVPSCPAESIACVECETEIPAGSSACPKCGWTYETS